MSEIQIDVKLCGLTTSKNGRGSIPDCSTWWGMVEADCCKFGGGAPTTSHLRSWDRRSRYIKHYYIVVFGIKLQRWTSYCYLWWKTHFPLCVFTLAGYVNIAHLYWEDLHRSDARHNYWMWWQLSRSPIQGHCPDWPIRCCTTQSLREYRGFKVWWFTISSLFGPFSCYVNGDLDPYFKVTYVNF